MKKYRLLYHDGWYFLPQEFIQAWSQCDSKADVYEAFRISLPEISNQVFYVPGEHETVDSLFNLDALKKEQEQVMKLLTDTKYVLYTQNLREKIIIHLIQYSPDVVQSTIECADKLIKYIINGNSETT